MVYGDIYDIDDFFSDLVYEILGEVNSEKVSSEVVEDYMEKAIERSCNTNYKAKFTNAPYYGKFDIYNLRGEYNFQGFAISENNFPIEYYVKEGKSFGNGRDTGDYVEGIYSDRLSGQQRLKISQVLGYALSDIIPSDKVIQVANVVFGRDDFTGARVVRYLNNNSHNHLYYIEGIVKSPLTPKSEETWDELLFDAEAAKGTERTKYRKLKKQ